MKRPGVALLIGFDRSGTSLIAGLLARHPRVRLLFQPFNGTEVHRSQWQPWSPGSSHPATEAFVQGLEDGEIDTAYVASDWFAKHSTTDAFVPGALHVVKDTKLHLQLPWLRRRFPELPVFGLWRDPRGIVCSLLRNGFWARWYGDAAFEAVRHLIEARREFARYRGFASGCAGDARRAAVVVAVRNDALFRALPRGARIAYEDVLRDADGVLGRFVAGFGLPAVPFARHLAEDHNVIGLPFERADLWRDYFGRAEQDFMDELFAGLGERP